MGLGWEMDGINEASEWVSLPAGGVCGGRREGGEFPGILVLIVCNCHAV